jgi:DNA-binding XRE family transcriptional regulator
VELIDQGRVSSQAEAARLLGVSKETVNKVVLSYGLGLKYTRPPRPVLTCKNCSRRYHPTPRSREGTCVPCQWVAKQRGGPAARAKTRTDLSLKDTSRPSTARDALVLLLKQGPVASQAEAARTIGVSRQAISQIALAEGLGISTQQTSRVLVVCPGCGLERSMAPSVARQRATGFCQSCWRRSGSRSRIPRPVKASPPIDVGETREEMLQAFASARGPEAT